MKALRRTLDVLLVMVATTVVLGLSTRTPWAAHAAPADIPAATPNAWAPFLQFSGWLLVMVNATILVSAASKAIARRRRA